VNLKIARGMLIAVITIGVGIGYLGHTWLGTGLTAQGDVFLGGFASIAAAVALWLVDRRMVFGERAR